MNKITTILWSNEIPYLAIALIAGFTSPSRNLTFSITSVFKNKLLLGSEHDDKTFQKIPTNPWNVQNSNGFYDLLLYATQQNNSTFRF